MYENQYCTQNGIQTEIYGTILNITKMLPWCCTHVDFSQGYSAKGMVKTETSIQ